MNPAAVDYFLEIDTTRASPDVRQYAREQAQKLLSIVKLRTRGDKVMTCKACAKKLGVKYHVVQNLTRNGQVWTMLQKIYSKRSRQHYKTAMVDIDEVAAYLEQRDREQETKKATVQADEMPPDGWISLDELHQMTAVNINSLRNWARAGDLHGRKFIDNRDDGRRFWNWYVDPDGVIDVLRHKIHDRKRRGGNLKRIESIEVTPLIRDLWNIVEVSPRISAVWKELTR